MFLKFRELYYRFKFYFNNTKKKSIILPNDCNTIRIVKKEFYRY